MHSKALRGAGRLARDRGVSVGTSARLPMWEPWCDCGRLPKKSSASFSDCSGIRTAPGDYQWFGYRIATVKQLERRWYEDGLIGDESSYLTVDVDDGTYRGMGHLAPDRHNREGRGRDCVVSSTPWTRHRNRGAASTREVSVPRRRPSIASRPEPRWTTLRSRPRCKPWGSGGRGFTEACTSAMASGGTASCTACSRRPFLNVSLGLPILDEALRSSSWIRTALRLRTRAQRHARRIAANFRSFVCAPRLKQLQSNICSSKRRRSQR